MSIVPFALVALIPAVVGPLPVEAQPITAVLCGGGLIALDIPQRERQQPEPCPGKACHAPGCRKRFDPAQ